MKISTSTSMYTIVSRLEYMLYYSSPEAHSLYSSPPQKMIFTENDKAHRTCPQPLPQTYDPRYCKSSKTIIEKLQKLQDNYRE